MKKILEKKFTVSLLSLLVIASLTLGTFAFATKPKESSATGLNGNCSLDLLNGAVKEGPGSFSVSSLTSSVIFQGWISNVASQESPEKLTISLQDENNFVQWSQVSKPDFARPDVVTAFKTSESMLMSGFNVSADLMKLSPGTYQILLQGEYSGRKVLCSNLYTLTIKL